MNIVFFGSSDFAVPSLKAILDTGRQISCVVTQLDRPKGRGLHTAATAVKETALQYGLKLYQPRDINSGDSLKFLKGLEADLFIVIAYGQILSSSILDVPAIFSVNMHASLLPEYRGAAPVNWAIIRGEEVTGVTAMKIVKKMDAGPILAQKATDINSDDTAVTLEAKLAAISAELLPQVIKSIEDNDYNLAPQDEGAVTFAPKLKKEDGLIDWARSAEDIHNLIRGCLAWPGAFTYYKGKLVKIYRTTLTPEVRVATLTPEVRVVPGCIIDLCGEGITVATGEGDIIIKELQIEGSRPMGASEFIAGHKIHAGEIFSKKSLRAG